MKEKELREKIVMHGKSLFDRGYTAGCSGNISAVVDDGVLLTPTNSCMGRLDAGRLSKVDRDGKHVSGDTPSKELVLHLAVYNARPDSRAVVHLHSPHAVAVSCLQDLDPENALPPITPYFALLIGRLPVAPYFPPGDPALADAVGTLARAHNAVLAAQHGPVVSAGDLDTAVYSAEELEEAARLFLLLQGRRYRVFNREQAEELRRRIT
jgi:ribulose-5-phosphate 4-epimerase/fuculose-1-phosphate aldolase